MMKETSLKKNIIMNTFYQILTMIIPFITAPYISRVIGVEGVGIYSFTNSIQTYFSMFAALGTISYGTREIARARNDENKRSKLFWEIEILTIITSIICLLIWGVLIYFSKEYKVYFIILTMNLLNTLFDISWFYAGLEQFKYTITKNSIFKILGVILLFILVKEQYHLKRYIVIMSATTLLGTLTMWLYLPKFLKKVRFKDLKILPHIKETLIYFVPTISTSIYTVLDKTLIGLITNNDSENGFYEQATKIINMTKSITFTSINVVFGSRISYLFSKNKIKEIHEKIELSINYICFIGFGVIFGLIGVASNFVPVFFGNGYDKVIVLIRLLSPVVIIVGISGCLGSQYYNPAGFRAKSSKYIIIGSVVNLILNLLLIPNFQSCGAIFATILAETVITLLYVMNSNGFVNLKMLLNYSFKKIISGFLMCMVVLILNNLAIENKITILGLQVFIGVSVYILGLFLLKDDFLYYVLKKIKNIVFFKNNSLIKEGK